MSEQTITLTQDELDEIIAKRIARVRMDYEDSGQKSFRAYSRKWEERAKAARAEIGVLTADRDTWRNRAKSNLARMQLLQEQQEKLLNRLQGADK